MSACRYLSSHSKRITQISLQTTSNYCLEFNAYLEGIQSPSLTARPQNTSSFTATLWVWSRHISPMSRGRKGPSYDYSHRPAVKEINIQECKLFMRTPMCLWNTAFLDHTIQEKEWGKVGWYLHRRFSTMTFSSSFQPSKKGSNSAVLLDINILNTGGIIQLNPH